VVSDYRGRPSYLWARRLAAANPVLHPALLEMLADAHARPEDWPLGRPFPGPVPLVRRDEEEPL